MNITEITRKAGARPKRKRVGRGEGSGSGKTSGRGNKGAGARAGYRRMTLAEGGMFPLFRRLPKFGFSNVRFRTVYRIVNVADLDARFESGAHVTPAVLEEAGLVRAGEAPVKVLGDGELKKKLQVEAHRFSATASAKIETAGGSVKWLAPKPKKKFVKRPKTEETDTKDEKKSKAKAEKVAPEAKSKKKPPEQPEKPDQAAEPKEGGDE